MLGNKPQHKIYRAKRDLPALKLETGVQDYVLLEDGLGKLLLE